MLGQCLWQKTQLCVRWQVSLALLILCANNLSSICGLFSFYTIQFFLLLSAVGIIVVSDLWVSSPFAIHRMKNEHVIFQLLCAPYNQSVQVDWQCLDGSVGLVNYEWSWPTMNNHVVWPGRISQWIWWGSVHRRRKNTQTWTERNSRSYCVHVNERQWQCMCVRLNELYDGYVSLYRLDTFPTYAHVCTTRMLCASDVNVCVWMRISMLRKYCMCRSKKKTWLDLGMSVAICL